MIDVGITPDSGDAIAGIHKVGDHLAMHPRLVPVKKSSKGRLFVASVAFDASVAATVFLFLFRF